MEPKPIDLLLDCFRKMLLIRRFEETLSDLFERGALGGTSHFCIGQEACAVGVISAAADTDYIVSNHRGHGHLLARGLDPVRVFGELMGRTIGYCGGRGGSQHMCAMDHSFLGTNGITGGGIPVATGAAFALKYRKESRLVLAFFGDGAANQGTFHESLNIASLWKLPVLYVCENNRYGMSVPVSASTSCLPIAKRAAAYSMRGVTADGMDLLAVRRVAAECIAHVRSGAGPVLLELETYRFCGHSKNDPRVYRSREEEARWAERDCIVLLGKRLREEFGISPDRLESIRTEVDAEVEQAVAEAQAAPSGDDRCALGGVYA
ncbi:MAG: thiamine pyrophosphate-dependent dehydrogenase E1 component subunit alpha [Kiritimatiellaeota bacterium]|nr:thiamine pyrophosphate-dependent dehydrogenase E1 component subunit alpha [Kiritimatiellota bacterium]